MKNALLFLILILFFSGCLLDFPIKDPFVPVELPTVVLIGQSNAGGRGYTDSIPEYYHKKFKCLIYSQSDTSKIQQLFPGKNTSSRRNNRRFGVETALGDSLSKLYDSCMIVKYAIGGTCLAQKGGRDWNVESHEIIDKFTQFYAQADTLAARMGYKLKVTHVIWIQGECDANGLGLASKYHDNLEALMNHLNTFWGYKPTWILGRLTDKLIQTTNKPPEAVHMIQQAEEDLSHEYDSIYVHNTEAYQLIDNLHYNSASLIQYGKDLTRYFPHPH